MVDNVKDAVVATVTDKVNEVKDDAVNKACLEAKSKLEQTKKTAAKTKTEPYAAADKPKTAAYAEADKVEKSYNNPLEKAAKKAAADAMRKKADDANKSAKSTADKVEGDAIGAAQKQVDANCK